MRNQFPERVDKSYSTIAIVISSLLVLSACATREPDAPDRTITQAADAVVECPPTRRTARAPDPYYEMINPLSKTAKNLESGRLLYHEKARPIPCAQCHGENGKGKGPMGLGLDPPPAVFACAEIMNSLPDGQLFWVIENGSGKFHLVSDHLSRKIQRPGRRERFTAMRSHKEYLTRTEIWQLVLYIRTFANDKNAAQPP